MCLLFILLVKRLNRPISGATIISNIKSNIQTNPERENEDFVFYYYAHIYFYKSDFWYEWKYCTKTDNCSSY